MNKKIPKWRKQRPKTAYRRVAEGMRKKKARRHEGTEARREEGRGIAMESGLPGLAAALRAARRNPQQRNGQGISDER